MDINQIESDWSTVQLSVKTDRKLRKNILDESNSAQRIFSLLYNFRSRHSRTCALSHSKLMHKLPPCVERLSFPFWRQRSSRASGVINSSTKLTRSWNRDMLKSSSMKRRTNKLTPSIAWCFSHSKAANFPIDLNEHENKRKRRKYQMSNLRRKREERKSKF